MKVTFDYLSIEDGAVKMEDSSAKSKNWGKVTSESAQARICYHVEAVLPLTMLMLMEEKITSTESDDHVASYELHTTLDIG